MWGFSEHNYGLTAVVMLRAPILGGSEDPPICRDPAASVAVGMEADFGGGGGGFGGGGDVVHVHTSHFYLKLHEHHGLACLFRFILKHGIMYFGI